MFCQRINQQNISALNRTETMNRINRSIENESATIFDSSQAFITSITFLCLSNTFEYIWVCWDKEFFFKRSPWPFGSGDFSPFYDFFFRLNND